MRALGLYRRVLSLSVKLQVAIKDLRKEIKTLPIDELEMIEHTVREKLAPMAKRCKAKLVVPSFDFSEAAIKKQMKDAKDKMDQQLKDAKDKTDQQLKDAKDKTDQQLKDAQDKADKRFEDAQDRAAKELKKFKARIDQLTKDLKQARK